MASALRGRRYLHHLEPTAEPVEELAEAAALAAGLVGLDETAGLPGETGNGSGAAPAPTRPRPERPAGHASELRHGNRRRRITG
jgi:hypothetical protein